MKRIKIITGMATLLSVLFCMQVSAATASLSGVTTVRAGNTVTLTYSVSGSNAFGVSGDLSYDSTKMTLTGTKQLVAAPWKIEFNGRSFVIYDDALSSPFSGSKKLFSAAFKVKDVPAGTALSVSVNNIKITQKSGNDYVESSAGSVSWSSTVLPPLSGNNNLSSLTVADATISPAFSSGVTSYTASVPFEVSKLQVSAAAEDGKSKVSISSPILIPNASTNISVTVTAENGAKKTYIIRVKRAQDPNYKPSGNNNLLSIKVNGYVLSPPFSTNVAQYVVWLPYETKSVSAIGTAADSKASVKVEGGGNLEAGKSNEIKVTCTAENGAKKVYIIMAKRASRDGGTIQGYVTAPTTTAAAVTQPASDTPQQNSSNGIPIWLVILLCILFTIIGAVTMWGFFKVNFLKK